MRKILWQAVIKALRITRKPGRLFENEMFFPRPRKAKIITTETHCLRIKILALRRD